jgi:aspartyl-tRNA(Asn)/glutamyl-tRNA(Gln) amidotransferase subunit A
VRATVQREMTAALQTYDLLVTPTAPTPAYKLGEKSADPLAMYKGDLMTVALNLAGLPGIVLPCAVVEEGGVQLPVGVQLIGRPFGELELIRAAHAFEQTLQLPAAKPAVCA